MLKSPLIIIGMHRSGTSLMAKVLEKAGIFMGVIKDHNFEAIHFLSLNQQTLWAAGGRWLSPLVPDKIYWKRLPARVLYEEHFKLDTKLQKLRYRLFPQAWGWKDPRNTFTLPMWLELFPEAKVLHITRDMEEVAHSLQTRNHKKGEVFDERLEDLNFNRKLAQAYHKQGRSYQAQLGDRYFEIDYADITSLNLEAIKKLEHFCGKPVYEHLQSYLKPAQQN